MGHVRGGRLSGIDVARVTKKLAARAGLDPAKYAGLSLRAVVGNVGQRLLAVQKVSAGIRRVRSIAFAQVNQSRGSSCGRRSRDY
jgi:hypothetical protein